MSNIPLPLTAEQITPTWLAAVLGFPVESIVVARTMKGTADKIFLTVKYQSTDQNGKWPRRICIKGCFNPELAKDIPPLKDFCRVEAQFFRTVMPTLGSMEFPKCFGTRVNQEQGIVVMEDLRDKGYTFGDPEVILSVEQVKDGVAQLAALHAGTWGRSRADYPWMTPYEKTMNDMFDAEGVDYDQMARDPARYKLPEQYRNGKFARAMLNRYFSRPTNRFQCLVHGDAHVGNTCFSPDGEVGFIDWQIVDSRPPFHDLSYFTASALSIDDRRKHEMEILQHYLDCLDSYGGPKLSTLERDVMIEYKLGFLVGMGWTVTTTCMQTIKRINAHLERFMAALVDHKVADLVEALPEPDLNSVTGRESDIKKDMGAVSSVQTTLAEV
ncbi:kinase-like domain-containing protein [Truncatella angustata]|uniref:Kinase-like domain-containing protein n=1 Tax=Truncatella angustata TaxID=152316 RepID=A0A9P8UJS3_9PEZI|nr:kinase-like domain-containing protein [Truncatella angustata]KAH6653530.1 kinase-like domain-containing protein [Truncatella angustata]